MFVLIIAIATVTLVTGDGIATKIFNVTSLDSSIIQFTYPWQQASECFFNEQQDILTCVDNYPYVNVTSVWMHHPGDILYISVNCLTRGQYRGNMCMCKNAVSNTHNALNNERYSRCQLTRLDQGILRSLVNLEVLDLSFNQIETVSKRALTALKKLIYISLNRNNIKSIPSGFLCQVPNLQYLGLSELPLDSYPLQSFRCKDNFTSLRVMDVRASCLSDIPVGALDNIPAIQSLDYSFNQLTHIEKKALSGSKALKYLDISNCNIYSIFPHFCDYLPNMSILYLHDNNFTTFDFTAIEQCASLTHLDLSSNSIESISGNATALHSLTTFGLASNKLSSLNVTFDGLLNLTSLILSNNDLQSFQDKQFAGLINLKSLDLSANNISTASNWEPILQDLGKLQNLDLRFNKITVIQNNTFSHLELLKELLLSYNSLVELEPLSFHGLNNLESLHLDNNHIASLPDEIVHPFIGEPPTGTKFEHLTLSHNYLSDLSNIDKWPTMSSLEITHNNMTSFPSAIDYSRMENFNASHNRLQSYFGNHENLVADFSAMKTFDVSFNRINDIDMTKFKTMINVNHVNMEGNEIDVLINDVTFNGMNNLTHLNLANNKIHSIENLFTKQSLTQLSVLNVSDNRIQTLGKLSPTYNDSSVETIDLSNCTLVEIGVDTFRGLLNLKAVYLRGNSIETFPPFFANVHTKYNLVGNPFICACNMSWFREKYVNVTNDGKRISIFNYKVPKCKVYTEATVSYPYDLLRRQFMCPEVDNCHSQCACFKTEQDGDIMTIECRNSLHSVPKLISSTALSIFLDGNSFVSNASLSAFLSLTTMSARELYLNKSAISNITANHFVSFEYLEILNLDDNLLTLLPSGVFKYQTMLKQLYLSDNLLNTIQPRVFDHLYSLQELDISGNNLMVLSPETVTELSGLDYMKYFVLARNQWDCGCSNIGFKDLVDDVLYKIRDRKWLICGKDTSREIRYVPRSEFVCSGEDGDDNSQGVNKTVIIISLVMFCVILIMLAIVIYYRRELLSLLYYCTGCHIPGRERYSGAHFDAYLTFDPSDQHCAVYVHNTLVPKLKNNSYSIQTSSDIIHDIEVTKKVIEDSRCSIFIVDNNFSSNSFLVDIFICANERCKREKRHKVILLIHGDIDLLTLGPEVISRMRKGDYITARSRLWWQRLVYELPEPSSGFRHGLDSEDEDVVVFSSLADDQSQYEQF